AESIPNAAIADRINNVECINFSHPLPGDYIVRVRAFNVLDDSRVDTIPVDQDFALVISGGYAPPGIGVIGVGRKFSRASDQINLFVADSDRAGNPSVNVTVRSTTEFSGES